MRMHHFVAGFALTSLLLAAGCDRTPGVSPPPPVTLRLSPDSATLPMHGSLRLSAAITGAGFQDTAVGYRSSDTSVVVVDPAGTLRVVGYGSAWIVGIVLNHPTAEDSMQVRVPAPPGPYLALLPDTATIYAGDGWVQLGWRVGGVPDTAGATTAVRLASSDTSVLEARASGLLCARNPGNVVVRGSLVASPATTDSARIHVLTRSGYLDAPVTISLESLVDSAGKDVDRNAVRGTIRARFIVDAPRLPCRPPIAAELRFDDKLWQSGPPHPWGRDTVTFVVDTRATDAAGQPLLPNGSHVMSALGRQTDGLVLMSSSVSLAIAN